MRKDQRVFSYHEVQDSEIRPLIDEIGNLRIKVFREFPYLYDGNLTYERKYLEVYARSARSLVVLLKADDEIVGATTALPMTDEIPEFQAPFLKAGYDLNDIYYFGESIILRGYRGSGAGKQFFKLREKQADKFGYRYRCFCAVDRSPDHPARPKNYRGLDKFWQRMGFQKRDDLRCQLPWKEPGHAEETMKSLTFWVRDSQNP